MAAKQSRSMPTGHTAGIYADMSLDGPDIGTLVVVIDRAKNLPNRKTMGKQDPYCAMRLGKEAKKTGTDRRGGQTPRWDQELRFTVHDSPDYYKLKCSVFNDDKKTDMIGEAWLDLTEVIVPGGGQNDLWHQLNFKGKYAGDIRVEMTYYDTRPNVELEAGKQRQKEKSYSAENIGGGSTSRQLGPREIKRRPLPAGPVHTAPAELPQPLRIPQGQSPSQSQPRHLPQPPPAHSYSQHQPQPQQRWKPEILDDYAVAQEPPLHDPCPSLEPQYPSFIERDYAYEDNAGYQDRHYQEELYHNPHLPRPEVIHSQSEPQLQWQDHPSPASSGRQHASSPYTQYDSSPPFRSSPHSLSDIPHRANRASASPTKYATHKDSPLRQSISQHDVSIPPMPYDTPYEDLDPPPPPPPTHRNSIPRPSSSAHNSPNQSEDIRQLPPPPQKIEDRSPLQMIEHQYHAPPSAPVTTQLRERGGSSSNQGYLSRQPTVVDFPADDLAVGEFPAPHQLTENYGVDFMTEPVEQDRQGRYVRRNSGLEDGPYRLAQRPHTFDTADVFDERNTFRSEPQLVRPRAVSPNPGHLVPRKSVSPHPEPQYDRPRLSGVPFGPDAYDLLNPSSDQAADPSNFPHNTKEARQKEVDKIREQGPIIGNDGRVIDPSDHLPSDTWAPEPERKTRKPEHVVRIRTKEDVKHSRAGSSPMPIKPLSASNSPYQLPVESGSAPNSGQRRNRLQKPMPTRPLPSKPFPHPHSSPAGVPQVNDFQHETPPRNSMPSSPMSGQRHSMYTTPPSGPLRPPLTEYQVPASNTYSPRVANYPQQQNLSTPTKIAQRPQSYTIGGYDDSLAVELSMIDIGPSRGAGRTALRSNRAYGGY